MGLALDTDTFPYAMLRCRGYRFRLKPSQRDAQTLRRFAGCSRFVWNELLLQNQLRIERGLPRLSYALMCSYLVYLKSEFPFLCETYSQALQQTLRDLDCAYRRSHNASLSAKPPRLKLKSRPIGICFPQGFKINGNGIFLPKLGWVGFRKSRSIKGTPKRVVLRFNRQHWFVTIITEEDVDEPVRSYHSAVGIDLGIVRFAALSDGTFVESVHASQKSEKRISRLQRLLNRKKKFSANWRKARAKLSRLARKIANIRRDMLHKASTAICKNHALDVFEDLRVANMSASAKGTLQSPGTHVRVKAALNKRILDQGWAEFRRQTCYKMGWSGGSIIIVDPCNTSRICCACGCTSRENRRSQSAFECIRCGFATNADTNAAINVLRRAGRARIACGDLSIGGSMKQEALLAALRQAEKAAVERAARQKEDVGGFTRLAESLRPTPNTKNHGPAAEVRVP
jgi:putative transposase